MRFVYQWLLLLLTALPFIGMAWLFLYRRAQTRLAKLIAPALQEKLMPRAPRLFHIQFTLMLAGLALLTLAAARPQWGKRDEKIVTKSRNVVVALDVSRSMLAADVHPNRLERAKADITDLIDELAGDRAALLVFRQKGVLLCPLTTDYAFLRQALDAATPESAPRGETDLGDAIRQSLAALDPAFDQNNAILLISDGEDLKDDALAAAKDAAKRNVPIFTVGIGDVAGSTIPGQDGGIQQFRGSAVKTKLVEKTLAAIATASHGRYIPLGTAGTAQTTLGAIYRRHLRTIAAREQVEQHESRLQERYHLFLVPALLCMLAAACFSRGVFVGKRRTCHATAVVMAALLLVPVASVCAQTTGREAAREAQALLADGKPAEAAARFEAAARGSDMTQADSYRFNAGFAYWKAGDVTNAVAVLTPLTTSKTHGARAAELLGVLHMAAAKQTAAEDPVATFDAREDAARAFQHALRAAPEDPRANRNFTRATDAMETLREAAHVARVMKEHQQTAPESALAAGLAEQRAVTLAARGVLTNDAPRAISESEALATRMKTQRDVWIPLKAQVLQSVTNQQHAAQMVQQIEAARDIMTQTITELEDLNPAAALNAERGEAFVYGFWKAVALPPGLIDEALATQKQVLTNDKPLNGRNAQAEALSLTQSFRERFPEWAKQYEQQAQSDTNMPPFTVADQQKIISLAETLEQTQTKLATPDTLSSVPASVTNAIDLLTQIRELLPKNPSSGQSQANPNQQQQNQDQQQKQQQEKQQQQDSKQDEKRQDEPQEQEQEKKQAEAKEEEKNDDPPQDVQDILRRALEREKEHEKDKRDRARNVPLSPSERDW